MIGLLFLLLLLLLFLVLFLIFFLIVVSVALRPLSAKIEGRRLHLPLHHCLLRCMLDQ